MPLTPNDLLARSLALAARVPWWAALLAAAAAYALLHPLARLRLPASDGEIGLAATAFAQLLIAIAALAQLLIPLALLLLAAASAYAAWRRYDLFTSVAGHLAGGALRGLSREECGLLLGEAFRRLGYGVAAAGDPASEQAARIVVSRHGKRFLVDFSHWKAWQVEVGLIERLLAAVAAAGADGALAVSSGGFSADAGRLAGEVGIELADGRRVRDLIRARWDPFPTTAALPSDPLAEPRVPAVEDDGKAAVGAALAALIRAEGRETRGLDRPPALTIGPGEPIVRGDDGPGPALGWGDALSDSVTPSRPRPRPRPSRVIDGVGMLLAGALLWAGWQWLAALPAQPETPVWDGVRIAPAASAERRTATAGKGERPLGELYFGPPPQEPEPDPSASVTAPPEPEPALMPKLSVWELEAAFNASYIPPPECANWQSSADMARCGNHRMRTLRAFIAGGGKPLPAMRGESLAATSPTAPARERRSPVPDGREENDRGYLEPAWSEDAEPEPIPAGPLAGPYGHPEATPDWRSAGPIAQPFDERPIPVVSWREEQARRESGEGNGGRDRDRLFVSPEDAGLRPGDWREDWMRR